MTSNVRVFVRPLPFGVSTSEVDDLFGKFGPVADIKLLRGYGFVEFKESEDAASAVQELNNSDWNGNQMSVEFAKDKPRREFDDRDRDRNRDRDRDDRFGDRRGRGGDRYNDRERGPPPGRGGPSYRVVVSNLPEDTVWQDLKDFARSSDVQVTYANCRKRDGTGILEFSSRDEMHHALDTLEGKDFHGQSVSLQEDTRPSGPPPPSRGGYRDDFRRGGPPRRMDRRDRSPRGRGGYEGGGRRYDDRRDSRSPPPRNRSMSRSRSRSPPPNNDRSPAGAARSREASRSPPPPPPPPQAADQPEDSGTW